MNFKKAVYSVVLMIAVLPIANLSGQTVDPDSAMTRAVNSAFWLSNNYPDSALKIADEGLARARSSGNKRLAAFAYKTRGWAFFRSGNADSAIYNLRRSTERFIQLAEYKEALYNYLNLSIIYNRRVEYDEAVAFLVKADSLNETVKNVTAEGEIDRQLGIIHRERGDYPEAIRYFKRAFDIYRQSQDTTHLLDAVSSLCIVYDATAHADSSLLLLQNVSPIYNSLPDNDFHKASMYEQTGDAYFQLELFEKAYDAFLVAYHIFVRSNSQPDIAFEAINLGKTLSRTKKFHDAEHYLTEAYQISDRLNFTNYKHDASAELTNLYEAQGNWPLAYRWLETEKKLSDSLQVNDRIEKAEALEGKYQAEKKDKEIQLLKKDRELNQALMSRRLVIQYGILAFSGLIVIIAFLAVNRYRLLQNERRRLAVEQLRNDIARDLHDDMGSVVSGINIISKVALGDSRNSEAVHQNFKKIEQYSGYIQEKMTDIVWAISPGNDTFERLIVKMKEFTADILEPLTINYNFIIEGDFGATKAVDLNARRDFYLFFKEVINNAAKYSGCSAVEIKISKRQHDSIELIISDNGKGFDVNQVKSGNGIVNMNARAKRLNGMMTLQSGENQGTTVILRIKIT